MSDSVKVPVSPPVDPPVEPRAKTLPPRDVPVVRESWLGLAANDNADPPGGS